MSSSHADSVTPGPAGSASRHPAHEHDADPRTAIPTAVVQADSCVLVIFGASGDLTRRKLLPAIYNLAESGHLPEQFAVLGVARQALDEAVFREQMRDQVRRVEAEPLEDDKWAAIERRLHYVSGEFTDKETYTRLRQHLEHITAAAGVTANYLFYLAVPPDLFGVVVDQLGAAGLTDEASGWRRVIIEKPFGYDRESARALNATLSTSLRESQIYRIDHYLGKETVQNILAFRFANGIFEPIWNRRYVDHVQMSVAEDVGVEQRGAYYEKAGALRDMVQNHMFQLLTLVAMEPPISFRAEDVRDEKVKVLHSILPLSSDTIRSSVVRGQYEGYTKEPNVARESRTETFVALRLSVENWRWAGVPFYLRTGKRLRRRVTEIAVQFKRAPFTLFRETPVECLHPNVLIIRIQPDEGISLSFHAKEPGPMERLGTVTMDFTYAEYFKSEPETGYETLLYDAMIGDQTLFHRMDIVEAGWQVVDPILNAWREDRSFPLPQYAPGSSGPAEADQLLQRDDRHWRC
jgi:glucose-6-phosphate 1-dehydrogenase